MKRFNYEITKVEKEVTETEINEEAKEEKEMGFIGRHKKGFIIGGVAAALAVGAGFIAKALSSNDEEDVDLNDVEESVDDETETETVEF